MEDNLIKKGGKMIVYILQDQEVGEHDIQSIKIYSDWDHFSNSSTGRHFIKIDGRGKNEIKNQLKRAGEVEQGGEGWLVIIYQKEVETES